MSRRISMSCDAGVVDHARGTGRRVGSWACVAALVRCIPAPWILKERRFAFPFGRRAELDWLRERRES